MKVALELQPCCGNRTGIGVYTYELAKRLMSDHDVNYVGNIFDFLGRNGSSSIQSEMNFPVKENRLIPYGVYRRIWKLLPMYYGSMFDGKADITHFFNFITPPKIQGTVITTIHDMTYIRYPQTVSQRNLSRLQTGMEQTLLRSDAVVTVSDFSKQEIIDLCNVPEHKIFVIPSAATPEQVICDRESLFKRLKITRPYILFVGTIEPRKNIARLLRAFDMLSEKNLGCQLVLCGAVGWKHDEIFSTLQKMKHKENVVLTGYLSVPERNTLYKYASVFAFPSIYEGFGTPLLEAMFWGVPVVSSNVASMPEVAGDAACYVDPFCEESIETGLHRVVTDPSYSDELIEKGKIRYNHFGWDKSAEKLQSLYRSFL